MYRSQRHNEIIVGGIVPVFKHRFKITGCDLFVYRYMSANPEKFPQEVIDNVRNYHMREGNLKDELDVGIVFNISIHLYKFHISGTSSK